MIIYHNNTSCLKEYWLWQKVNIYFKPNELSLSCTVTVPEAVYLKNAFISCILGKYVIYHFHSFILIVSSKIESNNTG